MDFLPLRKEDRALCKDCKVIPSENLSTQHRLLVMDVVINKGRKKSSVEARPRIKWGSLILSNALEIGENLKSRGLGRNEEVKRKVESKKVAYTKLVASKDDEERQTKKEEYKVARREAKLAKEVAVYFHKVLNDEGDKGFVLGELQKSEECRDYGYCRRTEVEEVKGAIHRVRRERVTGPDDIPVDFLKNTDGAGLEWLTRLFDIIFSMVKMPEEWR
ncbi:uncharacterized protein LOC124887121 [Capsicum annuum]|uniref:uncharacterized protein LOC124887121 n=1 Tax=Capsicum annuum TaxID=4072 RepID=UPI001FB14320|nr:uncharacterized protein LOC124887121 [Capsicum annuum]